jgi:hypothetical protein
MAQLKFNSQVPCQTSAMQLLNDDYYYKPFPSYSLFNYNKDLGTYELSSGEMASKLDKINIWSNFSYFSHTGFVASNSCQVENYSLAQWGFQEFTTTNIDENTKEEIQEVEELLKETFPLKKRFTSTCYFQY